MVTSSAFWAQVFAQFAARWPVIWQLKHRRGKNTNSWVASAHSRFSLILEGTDLSLFLIWNTLDFKTAVLMHFGINSFSDESTSSSGTCFITATKAGSLSVAFRVGSGRFAFSTFRIAVSLDETTSFHSFLPRRSSDTSLPELGQRLSINAWRSVGPFSSFGGFLVLQHTRV